MDEEKWPPESMGEVRTKELELSLQILGVDEHVWLDMRDIDMDTGLPEEGYDRIREIVADVDPDTILTFGPDGMTGHAAVRDPPRLGAVQRLSARNPTDHPARRARRLLRAVRRHPGAQGERDQCAREPGRGDRGGCRGRPLVEADVDRGVPPGGGANVTEISLGFLGSGEAQVSSQVFQITRVP